MLDLLRARLPNPPDREMHVAAEEQARITELRLKALAEAR
jgi:2-oxo-4-hydroxy-4-carboxy--5-ureidoimidazoline (OHCU) decarboxylase